MEAKEFKKLLAKGIYELSEGLSSDMKPIEKDILVKMTNSVFQRITNAGMPLDFARYRKGIDAVLDGKIEFYKLNPINLMSLFARGDVKVISINTPKEWQ